MVRFPMSPSGYEKLQKELKHFKAVERPTVVKDIEEARAHGDLSENAEYDAAKDKQAFVEGRIRELEVKVSQAQVIDITNITGDRVVFGATVTIFDHDKEEEKTWTIVGEEEADLKLKRISLTSPIAQGLIGKSIGDETSIRTPGGVHDYEIVAVEFTPW
jgi:transcription elongation factor GreA